MIPLRPAMDVSIPQGDPLPQSDGNQQPTDLTQNRIFMRLQGTQSATVGLGGGGIFMAMQTVYRRKGVSSSSWTHTLILSALLQVVLDWLVHLPAGGGCQAMHTKLFFRYLRY